MFGKVKCKHIVIMKYIYIACKNHNLFIYLFFKQKIVVMDFFKVLSILLKFELS